VAKNGEKLYSDKDVAILRKITNLLRYGGRISEIAAKVLESDFLDQENPQETKVSNDVYLMIEEYFGALLAADLRKIDQFENLIEISVTFRNRIEFIYYPLIERIRQDCVLGKILPSQEHFAIGHLISKMRAFLSTSIFNYEKTSCSVVCATPSNSILEGGLLTLACNMKLKGHNVFYLGPNLIPSDVISFAAKVQPAIVAVSIARPEELAPMIEAADDVQFPICVGGLGVRLIENPIDTKRVHLITSTGAAAVEKLESICLEYRRNAIPLT
jgi:methanogenic corrinoid protein MtbC1